MGIHGGREAMKGHNYVLRVNQENGILRRLKEMAESIREIILCACGCGMPVKWNKWEKGWNRFIHGHHRKGYKHSEEAKRKVSIANTGKKLSEETKKKIGAAFKGKKLSKEHVLKISIALRGKNNPMFGKIMSKKSREKMSIAATGNTSHLGHKHSEEAREKISLALMRCRTDGYCDIWSDKEYKKDCLKNYCEICKRKEDKTKGKDGRLFSKLGLHHKDLNPKNCHPDNLATLCRSCHTKLHRMLQKQEKITNEAYA